MQLFFFFAKCELLQQRIRLIGYFKLTPIMKKKRKQKKTKEQKNSIIPSQTRKASNFGIFGYRLSKIVQDNTKSRTRSNSRPCTLPPVTGTI